MTEDRSVQYILAFDNKGGESHLRAHSHSYDHASSTVTFYDGAGFARSIHSVRHPWSLHIVQNGDPDPTTFQRIP